MRKLHVNLGENSYDILFDRGLLDHAAQYIPYDKIAVITDENVNAIYGDRLVNALNGQVRKLVLPAGESTKSYKYLLQVYDFLLNYGLTRSDCVVALGGGVIGDLAGFAASTVLRGVPFVQIPTSLLAQVDSSVGGKVAVDAPQGKNLVGSFYQPKAVLIDPDCLSTLTERVYADGMAEVIKYGCIADKALFDGLANRTIPIDDILYTCCDIKRRVVEQDERDTGGRMVLNFGHTIGHAVEHHYNYQTYTHGEGVAVGMVRAAQIGEKLGITPAGTAEQINSVLEMYNLPTSVPVPREALTNAISLDKKSAKDKISFIFLKQMGEAVIHKMDKQELYGLL